MKKIIPVLLLPLILFLAGCEKNQADLIYDGTYNQEIEHIKKEFADYLARNYIPGGNIAIAKGNKIIYSEGFGWASKELQVPMTRAHKLRIGGVSQLFTNIIYLKLVEQGVLHPDSSVQTYLPDFPEKENEITLMHLAYHTSGIRQENKGDAQINENNPSIQKGLERFVHDELTGPPGMFQEQSMFNTILLGAILEKVSGQKFPALLKDFITDTLHLTNTVVDDPFSVVTGRADFYHENFMGLLQNAPFRDNRYKSPAKGILSNAEDLVRFGMAVLESDYFSSKFRENLFLPCKLYGNYESSMANGWVLKADKKGRKVNGNVGSETGGGAALFVFPEEKIAIAYSINLTLANNLFPAFDLAGIFMDEKQ